MGFSRQEYWSGVLLGASTGVPTHDKVMRENPDRQDESELEDHPLAPDLPERLPQNQNVCFTILQLSPTPLTLTGGYP